MKVIHLHRGAPAKPLLGAPCNGCGVCCAATPCPVGMLFLRQWRGACRALLWCGVERRYFCGMAAQPAAYLRWLPRCLEVRAAHWFTARIAAGRGCDAEIEVDAGK